MTRSFYEVLAVDIENEAPLKHIDRIRYELSNLQDFEITSYGPVGGQDKHPVQRRVSVNGCELKRASTDRHFGRLLYQLVQYQSRRTPAPLRVVEFGTCVGVSAMYILASLASGSGGKVFTFEGSPELVELADLNLRRFIAGFGLQNVDIEIISGPFQEVVPEYLPDVARGSHIAFVDGNHVADFIIDCHVRLRELMDEDYMILHDDINWNDDVRRAWQDIVRLEGAERCVELCQGFSAAKGLVMSGSGGQWTPPKYHLDSLGLRAARWMKHRLGNRC